MIIINNHQISGDLMLIMRTYDLPTYDVYQWGLSSQLTQTRSMYRGPKEDRQESH